MSENTLDELITDLRRQALYAAENYRLFAMLEARIRRAEAAERVAEAVERWRCEAHAANWQAVVNCLHGYDVAKEAVRKLEEAT